MVTRSLCVRVKATCGWTIAIRASVSAMWPYSVGSVRMNFRRAGVLKNRSRTWITVPADAEAEAGRGPSIASPATDNVCAASSPIGRDVTVNREMDAIEASASPRNPSVAMASRSSGAPILLVACGDTASVRSAASMPRPSSATRISLVPPASTRTSTRVAPPATLFSTSSFTTLAGRSITSPAAIWLINNVESFRIRIRPSYRRSPRPRIAASRPRNPCRRAHPTTPTSLPHLAARHAAQ